MKKKKILFIYRTKRSPVLENWARGEGPDSLLFGFNHLKNMGYNADFFDCAYSAINLYHPLFYPLEHAIINKVGMGFKLDQAAILLPKFNKYDVIVATGDSAGLPILLLKYLRIINKPVIFMSAGLAGALKGKTDSWVTKLYKKILLSVDIFTAYSQVEIDFFEKEMGLKNKIKYIPLATDFEYFSQKSNIERKVICAVGTEMGRDYKTFFEAVRGLSIQVEVACHPDNIKGLKIPSNVTIHFNIPVSDILKLYQRSQIAVVPCIERYRSSGQMVVLESASASLPVIAAKIKGITGAFKFKDKKHLLYAKPHDPLDLKEKINFLLKNPQKRKELGINASNFVKNNYTTKHLAKNLTGFIEKL